MPVPPLDFQRMRWIVGRRSLKPTTTISIASARVPDSTLTTWLWLSAPYSKHRANGLWRRVMVPLRNTCPPTTSPSKPLTSISHLWWPMPRNIQPYKELPRKLTATWAMLPMLSWRSVSPTLTWKSWRILSWNIATISHRTWGAETCPSCNMFQTLRLVTSHAIPRVRNLPTSTVPIAQR